MSDTNLHLIGNAHLDPAWLWHWPEGFAEGRATFASALERMDEYPGFIFTASAAALYQWIERTDPAMFAKIRSRVAEGRWCIVGGWHTQSDCNLPSGESFARNALYSQRYFKEKFGVVCRTGYCVDSFGHTGTLPQLLRLGGMTAYVFMRPMDSEEVSVPPAGPFVWEGVDGTRLPAFRIYYGYGNDNVWALNQQIKKIAGAAPCLAMCFYGVGDHGGGPTKELLNHLEGLKKQGKAVIYSSPDRYFEELAPHVAQLPVRRGEMLNVAVGCYSGEGRIKRANRRAEWLLLAAERLAALADLTAGPLCQAGRIQQAWKDVHFNHFHDILCGTSERRVCDQALEQYGRASQTASEVLAESVQRIGGAVDTRGPGLSLLVFNPHAFPVSTLVETDDVFVRRDKWDQTAVHMLDASGAVAPHQNIATATLHNDVRLVFPVELPALGWRLLRVTAPMRNHPSEPPLRPPPFAALSGRLTADETTLENEYLRLTVDAAGLVTLKDLVSGRDVVVSGGVPLMLEDSSDTWGVGMTGREPEAGRFLPESRELIEAGPLRARIRLRFSAGSSKLQLDYVLERWGRTVRVDAVLDWRERLRMLKLVFPVCAADPVWTSEIPYGEAVRAVNGTESPMHGWTDLSNQEGGLAIANDSKYGVDARDGALRITVVRSPVFVHQNQFPLRRDERYQDQGIQDFQLLLIPHGPVWRSEVTRLSHLLNCPPVLTWEGTHAGRLPAVSTPLAGLKAGGVVIMALKRAEDGGGWVLRAFEHGGLAERAFFEIAPLKRSWSSEFAPGQIKTFVIPDDADKPVEETDFLEGVTL